ncbi:MAG: type II toxin-antitoxin system ParD family antitoxin [Pseudomonadota bacterium]
MGKHTFVTSDDHDALLSELVQSGRYANTTEAISAALDLLDLEEQRRALRERLMEGYEEAKRGEFAEGTGEEAIRRAFGDID